MHLLKLFDNVLRLAVPDPLCLLGYPLLELVRVFREETSASLPELFRDMEPVAAHLGPRKILVLEPPTFFTAIGHKKCPLLAVSTLVGLLPKPIKKGLMTLEGRIDSLVNRTLYSVGSLAQRVDDADHRHLGVLGFLAALAAALRVSLSPQPASRTAGALPRLVGLSPALVLGRA